MELLFHFFDVEHPLFESFLVANIRFFIVTFATSFCVGVMYQLRLDCMQPLLPQGLDVDTVSAGFKSFCVFLVSKNQTEITETCDSPKSPLIYESFVSRKTLTEKLDVQPIVRRRRFTDILQVFNASFYVMGGCLAHSLSNIHPNVPYIAYLALPVMLLRWLVPVVFWRFYEKLFPDRMLRRIVAFSHARRCVLRSNRQDLARRLIKTEQKLAPYIYSPLSEQRGIRLLAIETDSMKPDLTAWQLVHVSLDDAPAFDAISYCWGSRSKSHSLVLGLDVKSTIEITESIYGVLQQIVPLYGKKYYWIDYLCINQEDESEKAHQIPMMSAIYGRADKVIGCLEGDADPELANFELQKRVLWQREEVNRFLSFQDLSKVKPISGGEREQEALDALFKNPFFSRRWIVPETVIAKNVLLLYNGFPISWALLMIPFSIRRILHRKDNSSFREESFHQEKARRILNTRTLFHEGRKAPISDLLQTFANFRVSRPHDHIYSLLSICDENEASKFPADYHKPIAELYADVVRTSLSSNSFRTFSMIGHGHARTGTRRPGLPSWVPDFSLLSEHWTQYYRRGYKAGGHGPLKFSITTDLLKLRIRGVVLDRVSTCCSELPADPDYEPDRFGHLMRLQLIVTDEFINEHAARLFEKAEDLKDAVWRTFCEDYDGKAYPADSSFAASYDFWRNRLAEYCRPAFEGLKARLAESEKPGSELLESVRILTEGTEGLRNCEGLKDYLTLPLFELCGTHWLSWYKLAVTEKGFLAMVPNGTRTGDVVAVMQGAYAPHILRQTGANDGIFSFYGEAYVHGLMGGEAMKNKTSWITLV